MGNSRVAYVPDSANSPRPLSPQEEEQNYAILGGGLFAPHTAPFVSENQSALDRPAKYYPETNEIDFRGRVMDAPDDRLPHELSHSLQIYSHFPHPDQPTQEEPAAYLYPDDLGHGLRLSDLRQEAQAQLIGDWASGAKSGPRARSLFDPITKTFMSQAAPLVQQLKTAAIDERRKQELAAGKYDDPRSALQIWKHILGLDAPATGGNVARPTAGTPNPNAAKLSTSR